MMLRMYVDIAKLHINEKSCNLGVVAIILIVIFESDPDNSCFEHYIEGCVNIYVNNHFNFYI